MARGISQRSAARPADVPTAAVASRSVTTYWISHPTEMAFSAAFSPEGVGQLLMVSERWPAGQYVIRAHRPDGPSPERDDVPWGQAVKDPAGNVWIEPVEEAGMEE
jgi:hypothetical protein